MRRRARLRLPNLLMKNDGRPKALTPFRDVFSKKTKLMLINEAYAPEESHANS